MSKMTFCFINSDTLRSFIEYVPNWDISIGDFDYSTGVVQLNNAGGLDNILRFLGYSYNFMTRRFLTKTIRSKYNLICDSELNDIITSIWDHESRVASADY